MSPFAVLNTYIGWSESGLHIQMGTSKNFSLPERFIAHRFVTKISPSGRELFLEVSCLIKVVFLEKLPKKGCHLLPS